MSFLTNLFSGGNPLNTYKGELETVNSFRDEVAALTQEQIQSEIKDLRFKIKDLESNKEISENLKQILPRVFALTREAAKRSIGQFHYDVQLAGGIALSTGKIAEMKTGEGKTLTATLPLVLYALAGKGAH